MSEIVEVEDLVRTFKYRKSRKHSAPAKGRKHETVALDHVSLRVREGQVHGLLGPNGAGKTTLVKILSTVLLPTSGSVRVFGTDVVSGVREVRGRIGIVFGGERGVYGRLTTRENLNYWAALYGLSGPARTRRVEEVAGRFGLGEHLDTPVDRMSRGMKQRLHLARGLLPEPELLFLDEPTVGMDPVAAREMRTVVRQLRSDGCTVLLTTHDMAEAEELCDQVTLIDHGRILATEDPHRVGRWVAQYERVEAQVTDPLLLDRVRAMPGVGSVERQDDGWQRIQTVEAGAALAVLEMLVAEGISAVRVSMPSLQEVYLHLIGDRGLRV